MELLGAALYECNVDRSIFCAGWSPRGRGVSSPEGGRHTTNKSPRQQLAKECHPSSNLSRCPCRLLADSKLHQPCPPQGSGHDWLLHVKRVSRGGRVAVVVVWLLWLFLTLIDEASHVYVNTTARSIGQRERSMTNNCWPSRAPQKITTLRAGTQLRRGV